MPIAIQMIVDYVQTLKEEQEQLVLLVGEAGKRQKQDHARTCHQSRLEIC